MRYVRNKLVLRLHTAPGPELLARINDDFRAIAVEGGFTVSGPLPEEQEETSLAGLSRLVFRFNRRSLGRLRQLIDLLNRELSPPTG